MAITANSFPPGSTRAFIDSIIRQQQVVDDTKTNTDQNTSDVKKFQDALNATNKTLETTTATASSALTAAQNAQITANSAQSAANSAGNGVGDINMNAVFKNATGTQTVGGPLGASQFNVGGNKVVGARVGGWTPPTGAESRAGLDADLGFNASATYLQSDIQALASGLIEVRKLVAALQNALSAHGLIG